MPAGAPPSPVPIVHAPEVYTDLSDKVPPHWAIVDLAVRNIQRAMKTGAFYTQPEALAAVQWMVAEFIKIIARYSSADASTSPSGTPKEATSSGADDFLENQDPGDSVGNTTA